MAEIPENQELTLEDEDFRMKGNNGTNGSIKRLAALSSGIGSTVIPKASLRIVGLNKLGPVAGGLFSKA